MRRPALFAGALALLSVFSGLPLTGATYHWNFDKALSLKPYPKDAAERVKLVPDAFAGTGALSIANVAGKKTSAYTFIRLPGEAGVLTLELHHRMTVEQNAAADFTVSLFFNRTGGRQGSAGGTQKLVFDSSDKWTTVRRSVPVPADATAMQLVVEVANGAKTLLLDELKCSFASDSVTVPVGTEAVLSGFYELDRPAVVPTEVKVKADRDKLQVTFLNREPAVGALTAKAVKRDDPGVFSDDCNELFLYDHGRDRHWQFAVNSKGVMIDGDRYRKQDGDPWQFRGAWDSHASARASVGKESWESVIEVPWSDLGIEFRDGLELGIDFCRERKNPKENTRWNCGGFFGDTGTYASLKVADGKVTLRRHRSARPLGYTVKRARPQFESLLRKGVPGKYTVGSWGNGYSKPCLPPGALEKIGEEGFAKWQDDLLNAWGAAHMEGPFFPWNKSHLIGGLDGAEKYHRKWQMRYPFFTYTSSHRKRAIAAGGKYVSPGNTHISPVDPAVRQVMVDYFRSVPRWGREYELMKASLACVEGPDEPTNAMTRIFTISNNPEHAAALRELSEVIRRDYGFGRYGLPDDAVQADEARPFERIAYLRWWNDALRDNYAVWREEVARIFPGVPFKAANNNTTAGWGPLDYAKMAEVSDILGVDPYPTSVTRVFDHARAIHHTGFSVRLLRDLAPKIKVHATLQGFVYHSGKPGKADLNEWTAQALKNGADGIVWYDSGAVREIYPEFVYMINLSRMVTEMERVNRPAETVTGILHSDYDAYALNDNVLNPAYSLYVLLGEELKSNFRYLSPSGIANGTTPLEGLKLLYVPRGAYTTPELTGKLRKWVAEGGTLIAFDPRFQSWNLDGTPVADRRDFTGAKLGAAKKNPGQTIRMGKKTLKLAENRHIRIPTGFAVESYELTDLAPGTETLATDTDGKPAAIVRTYGKGKVITFAAQPFGNASLALEPGQWLDFFRERAREAGEKTGLAIWDFTLPEAPEAITLKKPW